MAAEVEERSRPITLHQLNVYEPSHVLTVALDAWAALERELCLAWLDSPYLSRRAVEDLLFTTFVDVVQSAARHDQQAQRVLTHLQLTPASQ